MWVTLPGSAMLDLLRDAWTRVQDDVRARVGSAAFDAWLAELRPVALERGVFYLEAKSRLVCERVKRLYQPLVEEILSREIGTSISVSLVPSTEALLSHQIEVGPTRPIVDSSNNTAYLVLESLAHEKELPSNLFFVFGPAGCGKTFLTRWWAQETGQKLRQFDGEGLVKAFGACMRDRRVGDLRQQLEEPRPLLIDEVHRIAGHRRLQRELLSALKERELSRCPPALMASRWHPREIWKLDPDLASYFVSGFVTQLEYPGPEARLRYLRALEGSPSRNGRAPEIEELARQVRGSYLDLRRAWALQRESGPRPARYLRLIDPRNVFERIRVRVADGLGVSSDDLLGKSQGRRASFARQVLSYLCVREGLSRAEVGRFLGGRSRAAISYATKTLERRMAQDAEVRAVVEEFM